MKGLESERKKERSDSVFTTLSLVSRSIREKVKEENPNLCYQMALNDIQTTEAPPFTGGAHVPFQGDWKGPQEASPAGLAAGL